MNLFKVGLAIVLLGFALAFVAALLPTLGTTILNRGISFSGGGCVIIMFIPICFGVGEHPLLLITLSAVLAVLLIVISFLILRLSRNPAVVGPPA